jgi:adenylate kinase
VLLLEAPDDVLVKRIGGRRSSPTGRVYNIYFNPPDVEGICDDSGEPLLQRADDEPDTVRHRLRVYQEQTEPLVAYYAAGIADVVHVQGDQGVDAVQADLVATLAERAS